MATDLPEHDELPRRDVISVFEETARVDKRSVESGAARVHVAVTEHDETLETMLRHQAVSVERVPMNVEVAAAPPTRQDGDTVVISVVEERLVVEKRLFVTEEVRIRIDQTPILDTQVVRLRREHAEIELDDTTSLNHAERTMP